MATSLAAEAPVLPVAVLAAEGLEDVVAILGASPFVGDEPEVPGCVLLEARYPSWMVWKDTEGKITFSLLGNGPIF